MNLSPTAQHFQDTLNQGGWPHQVIEMPATTRTAAEAAQAVGCKVEQIVKSIIFRAVPSDSPVLVVASGANRIDEKQVERLIGEKITKADADFVRQRTGYVIGGVPPLGHSEPIKTLIDEDLFLYPEIWAAAGTPNAVFHLTPDDLKKMTNGLVAVVKKS